MTTLRTVTSPGGPITYELERKRVKRVNLRVRQDGTVYLSAAPWVPVEELDEFVLSRSLMILVAQAEFRARRELGGRPLQYADGEKLRHLGEDLALEVRQGKAAAVREGDRLVLTLPHPEDDAKRKRLAEGWQKEQCPAVFRESLERQLPLLSPYGVTAMPELRLRTMTSRWGSCLVQKKVVTLNTRLVEAPPHCVDYVVLHELCHLVHPDHSKAFHALMTALMPDWKARKKALNAQCIL